MMDQETIEIDSTASESGYSASNYGDPEVEYDEWKDEILDCLDGIKSSGDFSVSRTYPIHVNPCLHIAGHEAAIPLPLTDHDAEAIRGACREAPFGKGDETLVDTSVRKTWELDAARFECTNPSWPAFLDTILRDVATGFGLPEVKAKPYKLLLYEQGSFFKRHKDSEKEAGMVATLVVCLPGAHTGGDVHLSFGSEERELATAPASRFDVTAMAWFSDLDHEVKPLESGNRLVLTYKLFHTSGVVQSAQFLFGQSQKVKSLLSRWQADFSDRFMLAYPLDHLYTKTSLSVKNLKGRDRAVCHSLKEVSAACGLYLTLAHMTRSEMEDYAEYFGEDAVSTELDTVYSCDGVPIGSFCPVDESEILVPDFFEDRNPDSEDEGEFTGNASMPAAFRYHNTVAVLTPMHQLLHYLRTSNSGINANQAENILSMVKKTFEEHRDNAVVKANTLKVMTDLLDVSHSLWAKNHFTKLHCTIAKWALERNHEDLFQKALKTLLNPKDPKNIPTELPELVSNLLNEAYAKSSKDFDWDSIFGPFLRSTTVGIWDSTSKKFAANLVAKAVKDSFSLWARSKLDDILDVQKSFGVHDHDFFLDNLGRSMENDRTLEIFSSRSTRELIFKALGSMFQRRAQYDEGLLKGIFENTLEVARSRLVLQPQDLGLQKPSLASLYSIDYHHPTDDDCKLLFRQFAALVQQSLALGVSDKAILLVEEFHKIFDGARSSWDPSRFQKAILARELLAPIASAFNSHQVSPTPSVRAFFELLIRDVLHHQIPKYPQKLSGWRHKRRECRYWKECDALNAFLESEDQKSWSLRANADIRKHIESHLPSSIFSTSTLTAGSPYTLVVEKRGTEHEEEVKRFRQQLAPYENALAPLRGDVFRSLLGDATYQELIELEHLRAGTTQGYVAGVKRSPESDLAGDSVRQRV